MIEILGDFWEHSSNYDAICVTTNGIVRRDGKLVMGAGIAKQFAERYPALPVILGRYVSVNGNEPKVTQFKDENIISFPTKYHYQQDSNKVLILNSAREILKIVDKNNFKKVLSTRPGCGLGNLEWDKVKNILERAGWDDRFTIISPLQ